MRLKFDHHSHNPIFKNSERFAGFFFWHFAHLRLQFRLYIEQIKANGHKFAI